MWSIDFMSDALWDGPRFRTFSVLDDFNREARQHAVELRFIQPGKPNQNACIERFNRTCRRGST